MTSVDQTTGLESLLASRKAIQAEIDALSAAGAKKSPSLRRSFSSAPDAEATKLKALKLQLAVLGMKIAKEQAKTTGQADAATAAA